MDDWIMVAMTTIVAPVLSGTFAYLVTRRRDSAEASKSAAEANGVKAVSEKTYREMFYDEAARRELISKECEEAQDAFKQALEENAQLRAENAILRNQVTAAGLPDLLHRPDTKPIPRRGGQ